jgi:hypothetical protein
MNTAGAILDLQRAGFTREQVEALTGYVESRLDFSHLATKTDLAALKADLEVMIAESKAELIKWVVGVGFVQVATILAVLKLFPGGGP